VDETGEETFIAESVDESGNAFGVGIDSPKGSDGEDGFAIGAGDLEAVLDVGPEFPAFEGIDVETDGDPLSELAKAVIVQAVSELRLAEQDDLEQFAIFGFEVGEESDLFEEFGGEVLGFVDDQDGVAAVEEEIDKELIESGEGFEAVHAFGVETILEGDGTEELVGIEDGIEDEGGGVVFAEFLEDGAADGGFAAADLAGELNEALAFADTVDEVVEGFTVSGVVKKVARVGRQIERRFLQAVKVQIHAERFRRVCA
jgi:hypothetical protein